MCNDETLETFVYNETTESFDWKIVSKNDASSAEEHSGEMTEVTATTELWIKLVQKRLTWTQARDNCADLGQDCKVFSTILLFGTEDL